MASADIRVRVGLSRSYRGRLVVADSRRFSIGARTVLVESSLAADAVVDCGVRHLGVGSKSPFCVEDDFAELGDVVVLVCDRCQDCVPWIGTESVVVGTSGGQCWFCVGVTLEQAGNKPTRRIRFRNHCWSIAGGVFALGAARA